VSSEVKDADNGEKAAVQTGHHKRVEAAKVELNGDDAKPNKEGRTNVVKVEPVKSSGGPTNACLVLIYPAGPDMGRRFALQRDELSIGRGADTDIQVDRDSVSRLHALVARRQNEWTLEDLGSTNGSYVNDAPVTKVVLRDGDFVRVGAAIFKFLTGDGAEAAYFEEIYRMTVVDALTATHTKR